jgi:hypothetical protein
MADPSVVVCYVNGQVIETTVGGWSLLRGDGIDHVDLIDDAGNASRIQGQSVYWLYQEGDAWVAGGGIVGHPEIIETAVPGHGFRRPQHMPDLAHDQVKLGWWLPGDGD